MKTKSFFLNILFFVVLPATETLAETQVDISYNEQTDTLLLDVKDAYLDDVLDKISEHVGFSFSYDSDIHHTVNLTIEGSSKIVIQTLVKPNSVILSQSETPPHQITKVILLPTGTDQSIYLPKDSLKHPVFDGDQSTYEQHMNHYNKKLNQKKKYKRKSNDRSKLLYTNKTKNEKKLTSQ